MIAFYKVFGSNLRKLDMYIFDYNGNMETYIKTNMQKELSRVINILKNYEEFKIIESVCKEIEEKKEEKMKSFRLDNFKGKNIQSLIEKKHFSYKWNKPI